MAPPLLAPPGFTCGHSFPPETPTKGPQGRQVTREGDTGRRGTDGAISFSTFSCSFGNDHVVFLNQRMNKCRRVKGGLDWPSLKQVSDEPDDTELWVLQPGVPSLCPWHTCVSRTHRPVSLSRRAPTGAAGGTPPGSAYLPRVQVVGVARDRHAVVVQGQVLLPGLRGREGAACWGGLAPQTGDWVQVARSSVASLPWAPPVPLQDFALARLGGQQRPRRPGRPLPTPRGAGNRTWSWPVAEHGSASSGGEQGRRPPVEGGLGCRAQAAGAPPCDPPACHTQRGHLSRADGVRHTLTQ